MVKIQAKLCLFLSRKALLSKYYAGDLRFKNESKSVDKASTNITLY
jgi:hypothetical protein